MSQVRLLAGGDTSSNKIGKVGSIVISQLVAARSRAETGYVTPNGLWVALPRSTAKLLPTAYDRDGQTYGQGFAGGTSGSSQVRFGSDDDRGGSWRHANGAKSSEGDRAGGSSSRAAASGEGEGDEGGGRRHKPKAVKPERGPPPELPFTAPGSYSGWGTSPPDSLSSSAMDPSPAAQRKHRPPPAPAMAPAAVAPQPRRPPPAPPSSIARAGQTAPAIASSPRSSASGVTTPSSSPRPVRRPPRLPAETSPDSDGGGSAADAQPQRSWRDQYVWSDPYTVLALRRVCSVGSLGAPPSHDGGHGGHGGDSTGWLCVEEIGERSPRILGKKVKPPVCPTRPEPDGSSAADERRRLLEARRSQALRPLRAQRGEIRWRKPLDPPVRVTRVDQPLRVMRCW